MITIKKQCPNCYNRLEYIGNGWYRCPNCNLEIKLNGIGIEMRLNNIKPKRIEQ